MTIKAQNNQLSTITGNNSSISKTMRSTDNKEVTFSYLPEDKIEISVKSDLSESRKVKSHDIPKDLKGLSTPSEFHAFLKNAYVKANELSNGDVKIYVFQKILGGMFRGQVNIKGKINIEGNQNIDNSLDTDSEFNCKKTGGNVSILTSELRESDDLNKLSSLINIDENFEKEKDDSFDDLNFRKAQKN